MAVETNQRNLNRSIKLGEVLALLAVLIPLLIALTSYQMKAHDQQINHEDRLQGIEKQETLRQKKDEKLDARLDEFQKSLNRIELSINNKVDRK